MICSYESSNMSEIHVLYCHPMQPHFLFDSTTCYQLKQQVFGRACCSLVKLKMGLCTYRQHVHILAHTAIFQKSYGNFSNEDWLKHPTDHSRVQCCLLQRTFKAPQGCIEVSPEHCPNLL